MLNRPVPEATPYPRRILLAVTGLTPQVVTETLYALARRDPLTALPNQVLLLTTREGGERARLSLLSEDPGWFARLRRDLNLPPIAFDDTCIRFISGADGQPLADLRTPEDNEAAADFITDTVRELTADPDSALHVSIAGGRKTMGYYLGYALSLYGRPQDQLSHVLVSEPFESSWEFFYPTPYRRVITTRDNKLVDTATAQVTLATIPFVSLRHGLPEHLLAGRTSFSAAVAAARCALEPPRLVFDYSQRCLLAAGARVRLAPRELAFLGWFARRAAMDAAPLRCPTEGVPETDDAEDFLREYRAILGPMGAEESTCERLGDGMDKNFFLETKSRVKRVLEQALGPALARPYLITDNAQRPKGFLLKLEPHQISWGRVIDDKLANPDGPGGEA